MKPHISDPKPSNAGDEVALASALARIELLERAQARLSQFVPRSVRRMIEGDPRSVLPTRQNRDVTILFLDVEGYTTLSDKLAPQRLARLIERYFSSFVDVLYEQGGDINETAGDGMMVLFQGDDPREHALRAARAALFVEQRAAELARRTTHRWPALVINIGISSGVAAVGLRRFAGRVAVRCTYTAIGSVTNRAARLQAEAREGCVLVGEETARRIGNDYELSDLGYRRVRNIAEMLRVYRLVAPRASERPALQPA